MFLDKNALLISLAVAFGIFGVFGLIGCATHGGYGVATGYDPGYQQQAPMYAPPVVVGYHAPLIGFHYGYHPAHVVVHHSYGYRPRYSVRSYRR